MKSRVSCERKPRENPVKIGNGLAAVREYETSKRAYARLTYACKGVKELAVERSPSQKNCRIIT